MRKIAEFFRITVAQARAVNRKYAVPQIKTTLFVKICLMTLRIYLLALVTLMIVKFISVVRH